MRPDIKFLRERFDYFNKLIFNPPLPAINLRISSAKRRLGTFRYPIPRPASQAVALSYCCISLSNVYDREQAELEDVIIHEMIHYCVWLNRVNETSHGPEFRRMMNSINQDYGRHISITENLPAEVKATDTRQKVHVIVAVEMPDGRRAFACVARTAVREVNKVLLFNKLQTNWYVSLDPWFNSFTTIRKPKLTYISEEHYKAHILSARPLKN